MKLRMKLHLISDRAAHGYAQFGSMWEKGKVRKCSFRLLSENGDEVPVQSRITAFWPDGSIKWAAHTADSSRMGQSVLLKPEAGTDFDTGAACQEQEDGWRFCSPNLSVWIPKSGKSLFQNLSINGKQRVREASLRLLLERHSSNGTARIQTQYRGTGEIREAFMEDGGPLMWSFCLKGTHRIEETGEEIMPFIVRLRFYCDMERIDIQHTFLFDGKENRDFLKGIGIVMHCPMEGEAFNRHIRFGTDFGSFHEAAKLMLVWDHKRPGSVYEAQAEGITLVENAALPDGGILDGQGMAKLKKIAADCPVWDNYQLFQDNDSHFCIRKKTAEEECCFLNALHGKRAEGTMAFGSLNGCIMTGLKDFWQKYPSGLEAKDLSADVAEAVIWIYSPEAEAYDYRHYDKRGYAETCYEGFSEFGATPYGIANTNDCSIEFLEDCIPAEDILHQFGLSVSKAPVYFGEPQYYHALHAFGYWSLPDRDTEAKRWLEEQLDKAVDFYEKEVEQRRWYGIYDYGDIMHTYDSFRHIWRYDIGGYAWQNTELMPTMWLWLAFLRSGRGDILRLAEAMSRHASDVDTYHLGSLKGLGTRHGVRHWGCSCKEIRIGMAGHYRYPYYLLCDRRLEDVFEDTKDADFALLSMDPLRYTYTYGTENRHFPTHARSGPDWSAMVSNWMTQWERTLDPYYLHKIRTGMEDIEAAPLGLISGPDFEYDPDSGHLGYIGESATGGTHLQIALGAPQVWMELADLLEDTEWSRQLADYGKFYYLTAEEKQRVSGGLTDGRAFLYPIMASAMAAYGAMVLHDRELANQTVNYVFRALMKIEEESGFDAKIRENCGNQKELCEIPWITTNFTSQWCLNVIMVLDFIKEAIPETLEEVKKQLENFPEEGLFRNC